LYNILLLIVFTFIASCGDPHYLLESDTPENLEGFLGIRWTATMSTVEEEFPKLTGANLVKEITPYNISSFSNVKFLDKQARNCKFIFDKKGLKAVSLSFDTNGKNYKKVLDTFKENLTKIYGIPNNPPAVYYQNKQPSYIRGDFWLGCRLELLLMPDFTIEINAYKENTCYKEWPKNFHR